MVSKQNTLKDVKRTSAFPAKSLVEAESYNCRFCAASDILVRRYIPGERRSHAVHFDGHAYVTAVLGISDPENYQGGLYIQPDPGVASRTYFRIEPGDLLVHSFDLQHGVHVWKGIRYSLVFWIKDSLQAVREGTTPWYHGLAEQGDPDALYNLAQNYEYGLFGHRKDISKAIELYERSARAGHHFAQNNLALVYRNLHQNTTAPAESQQLLQKSVEWLQAAAKAGFGMAQKNLALHAAAMRHSAHSRRRIGFLLAAFGAAAAFTVPLTLRRTALLGGLAVVVGKPVAAEGPSAEDAALLRRAFQALAKDPSRPGARDELEDAEEALTKVIEDFDAGAGRQDRGRIRMARAQARIAINDSTGGKLPEKAEAAVEDYSEVVRLMEEDPSGSEGTFDYPNVFVRRALAEEEIAYGRRDQKQWEAAVKDYTKAIDIWRSRPVSETGLGVNPLVLNFRGNALSQLGRFREALQDYREATEIFRKDNEYSQAAVSRCNEALALFGADEASEAVAILEDVSKRDPNIADAHVALAVSYWASRDYSRAEDEWRVACENTDLGCRQYKDQNWVKDIRRWPPQLVQKLDRFLRRETT
eukprot:s3003_g4.t1